MIFLAMKSHRRTYKQPVEMPEGAQESQPRHEKAMDSIHSRLRVFPEFLAQYLLRRTLEVAQQVLREPDYVKRRHLQSTSIDLWRAAVAMLEAPCSADQKCSLSLSLVAAHEGEPSSSTGISRSRGALANPDIARLCAISIQPRLILPWPAPARWS